MADEKHNFGTDTRAIQVEKFIAEYGKHLKVMRHNYPHEYTWPEEELPVVIAKMRMAFLAGTYSHSGRAVRATCIALKLKTTRTDMEKFFRGQDGKEYSK